MSSTVLEYPMLSYHLRRRLLLTCPVRLGSSTPYYCARLIGHQAVLNNIYTIITFTASSSVFFVFSAGIGNWVLKVSRDEFREEIESDCDNNHMNARAFSDCKETDALQLISIIANKDLPLFLTSNWF